MRKLAFPATIALGLVLTACGSGSTPAPTPTVTGQWTGTLSNGNSVSINIGMTQNNAAGDFTGTMTAVGISGSSQISGNVPKGTLVGVDASGYLACAGTFTNYSQYNADCVLAAGSSTIVKMSIHKQ